MILLNDDNEDGGDDNEEENDDDDVDNSKIYNYKKYYSKCSLNLFLLLFHYYHA